MLILSKNNINNFKQNNIINIKQKIKSPSQLDTQFQVKKL